MALKPLLDSSINWFVLELLVFFFSCKLFCVMQITIVTVFGVVSYFLVWSECLLFFLGQDSAPFAVFTVTCSHPLSYQHAGPGLLPEAAILVETYLAKPLLWLALCCVTGVPTGVQLWREEESHLRFCLAPLSKKGICEVEMKMLAILRLWWWHLHRDEQELTPWAGAIFCNVIRLVMLSDLWCLSMAEGANRVSTLQLNIVILSLLLLSLGLRSL